MRGSVLENAVLLRLSFHIMGAEKTADINKVDTQDDKKRLRLTKVLIQCPEYDAIGNWDGRLRDWVSQRGILTSIGYRGTWILPLALLDKVEKYLVEASPERDALVEKFMEVYSKQEREARRSLPDQVKVSDFPPPAVARKRFGMEWAYVIFRVPERLPAEIQEREIGKMEEKMRAMESDVRLGLSTAFNELVRNLSESLTPKADGSRRKFFDSRVENLIEFIELFSARNIVNFGDLARLVDRAKSIVRDATPQRLRKDDSLRDTVKDTMAEIAKKVDGLIEVEKTRRFDLD